MISPARILKSAAACVALLVASAWIAPASAQECKSEKERVTVKGRTITAVRKGANLEGRGNAMKFAIQEWEREVAAKVGEEWNRWDSAKDTDTNCEAEGTGVIASRRIACTISARPCQTREEDKNGEARKGDDERSVEREDGRDGRPKSDRFRYSEGKRRRDRDRDRYRDRDDDQWDRDRYRREFRYRWGAYDYDGRYTGYGPQYHRGYRQRDHDGYRHRHYGRGYDDYPRTWIPHHLCGEAQLLLYECGYGVAPNSSCGYRTSHAISRFQYRHGLHASGYPNERTMMALINVCGRR